MNGYDLSRAWFDFAYENARVVRPIHTAIYFWCIEKANRRGWVDEFQLPTDEACQALGIKDAKSFRSALAELIQWGAIRLVQEAGSQNIARYISFSGCDLSSKGCLDRAMSNKVRLSEKRTSDTPSEPLSDTPSDTPTSPLNIKPQTTNHKPQTNAPLSSPKQKAVKGGGLSFPEFAGDAFHQAWGQLLLSKKWKGKGVNALQISLNKLTRYDEGFSVELINSAIEKDWQGLVYDDTDMKWSAWQLKQKANPEPVTYDPSMHTTYSDMLSPDFHLKKQQEQEATQQRLATMSWNK